MTREQIAAKALALADFIYRLWLNGRITRSRARNALDRLALRIERDVDAEYVECVSIYYMRVA